MRTSVSMVNPKLALGHVNPQRKGAL